MFAACLRDHINKNEKILKHFNSEENCLLFIEEYLEDYIFSKQGVQKQISYFHQNPHPNDLKEGFFVVKSEFLRYEVLERVRSIGYLYNSFTDYRIFTISYADTLYRKTTEHTNIEWLKSERNDIYQEFTSDILNIQKLKEVHLSLFADEKNEVLADASVKHIILNTKSPYVL